MASASISRGGFGCCAAAGPVAVEPAASRMARIAPRGIPRPYPAVASPVAIAIQTLSFLRSSLHHQIAVQGEAMSKTILVVGATGNYAQPVCRQLSQDGFDVRVFTRRREKAIAKFGDRFPIFQGDVEDVASLRPAIEGCWGVHISLRGWFKYQSHDRVEHRGTANVVRLAAEAGVERLTYLSCLHARPEYAYLPHLKAKLDAEAAIRASGIPFAIFAPSFFMENAQHLQKGKRIFVPTIPRQAFHYL